MTREDKNKANTKFAIKGQSLPFYLGPKWPPVDKGSTAAQGPDATGAVVDKKDSERELLKLCWLASNDLARALK